MNNLTGYPNSNFLDKKMPKILYTLLPINKMLCLFSLHLLQLLYSKYSMNPPFLNNSLLINLKHLILLIKLHLRFTALSCLLLTLNNLTSTLESIKNHLFFLKPLLLCQKLSKYLLILLKPKFVLSLYNFFHFIYNQLFATFFQKNLKSLKIFRL